MEADLRRVLYNELIQFAGTRSLPVVLPNEAPNSQLKTPYLNINILPTEPLVRGICNGLAKWQWVVQVDVYARASDGDVAPSKHVDAIQEAFPFNTRFFGADHTFTVTRPAAARPPVSLDAWFFIPVQFRVTTIH